MPSHSYTTHSGGYDIKGLEASSFQEIKKTIVLRDLTPEDLANAENLTLQEKVRIQALSREVHLLLNNAFLALETGKLSLADNYLSLVESKVEVEEIFFNDELKMVRLLKSDVYYQMAYLIYKRSEEEGFPGLFLAKDWLEKSLENNMKNDNAKKLLDHIDYVQSRAISCW